VGIQGNRVECGYTGETERRVGIQGKQRGEWEYRGNREEGIGIQGNREEGMGIQENREESGNTE
jgi:hypothetical protein